MCVSFCIFKKHWGGEREDEYWEGVGTGGKVVVGEYQGFPCQLSHIEQFLWG